MKKSFLLTIVLLTGVLSTVHMALPQTAQAGAVKRIVLYVPNRVFDFVDILRLRLRVGPGLSAGVRVTEAADLFAGAHATIWVGLRGARGEAEIPWPAGSETASGAEISVADAAPGINRYTDPLEVGAEGQLGIIGVNFGVEFFEMIDLLAGFVFLDPQGDDF